MDGILVRHMSGMQEGPATPPDGAEDAPELSEAIRRKVRRLAGGDGERADELEQRVRIRVWESERRSVASGGQPRTAADEPVRSREAFRHGITVNVHREMSRENRRHRHLDLGDLERGRLDRGPLYWAGGANAEVEADVRGSVRPAEDPAVAAERGELFRLVRRAIQRLTDTSRMVVKMRYFENLQQRQIASEIGASEVRVSRILSRARRRLGGLLKRSAD